MSLWMIIVVTLCYMATATLQIFQKQYGFGLMWAAYAVANIGLIMAGGTK